jgi:hypothetical protein
VPNAVAYDPILIEHSDTFGPGRSLRGCHLRDLIDHALALADYRGLPHH